MKLILLIDDDRDDAELFKDALAEINPSIEFKHYDDAKEGLHQLLHTHQHLPDLIFLDINMPIINGWECLHQFKQAEHLKNIPVIMFTTSSQPREKEIAQDLGAAGFITKPSEFKELKDLLSSAINAELKLSK